MTTAKSFLGISVQNERGTFKGRKKAEKVFFTIVF